MVEEFLYLFLPSLLFTVHKSILMTALPAGPLKIHTHIRKKEEKKMTDQMGLRWPTSLLFPLPASNARASLLILYLNLHLPPNSFFMCTLKTMERSWR